ncbi:MAG TPA: hypothetical protein DCZ95_19570 [Verrucomicrobia bacterium]|nr:MAG: hypothetical protein A2X46_03070 [Lentisphaerae bacterium GWF2_57_35]HBA86287.1 hypothetical protein [Verrucomicrobiota bacterium]
MKKSSLEFLRKLVESISPSGYEDEAAAVWQAEAREFADEVSRDCHGNTDAIVHQGVGPRVMLAGHYDEIGFLISHIDEEGFLWIVPVGGWDPQIPQGHRVVIRGKKGHVPGVIGKCPIHLLKEEARNKVVPLTELWVDIGAANRKEAEKLVAIGDPLVLDHGLVMLQQDFVVARGFDNRAGAFVVLEAARLLSKMKPKVEVHAVATVQEEIGLRGAKTSAFGIDPMVGIAVDVTFATDYPTMGEVVKREGRVKVGKGPVITRGANINKHLFDLLTDTAEKSKIPFQVVAEPQGTGTDANAIQLTRAGVVTALVSVPNRYMHSSCELVSLGDLEACAQLIAETVVRIKPDADFTPF